MPKTTNFTVSIPFDEEKLNTLKLYLAQENKTIDEIVRRISNETINKLFQKTVPLAVQKYISFKNGEPVMTEKRLKKDKPVSEQTQENN